MSSIGDTGPIEDLIEYILEDELFIGNISYQLMAGNYFGVGLSIFNKSIAVLINDAFANGPNSILIRYLGSNIGFSVLEQVLIPVKLIGLTLKAIDVGLAISAYVSSDAIVELVWTWKEEPIPNPPKQEFSDGTMIPIGNSGIRANIDVNPNSGNIGTDVSITIDFTSGANKVERVELYSFGLNGDWSNYIEEYAVQLEKIDSDSWFDNELFWNTDNPIILRFYAIKSDGVAVAVGDVEKDGGGSAPPYWNDGIYD